MTSTEPQTPATSAAEEALVQAAAIQLRDLVEVNRSATQLYKALAITLVQIRKICTTRNGKPDVAGRSQHYRDLVARVYSEAGVPPDDVSPLQATIRYHVGNAVREAFTPEEIEEAGLSQTAPRDRLATAVRAAGGQDDVVHALEEVVQAIDLRAAEENDPHSIMLRVVASLGQVREQAVRLEEEDRRRLFLECAEVARELTALMNDLTVGTPQPTGPGGTATPSRTGRAA